MAGDGQGNFGAVVPFFHTVDLLDVVQLELRLIRTLESQAEILGLDESNGC